MCEESIFQFCGVSVVFGAQIVNDAWRKSPARSNTATKPQEEEFGRNTAGSVMRLWTYWLSRDR